MKALIVVAFRDYQDQEYSDTRKGLEDMGIEIEIASTEKGRARGRSGSSVDVDILLEEVNVNEFAAIVFIGGVGAIKHMEDNNALNIVKEAYRTKIIVAAICCTPMILKRAGILEGGKATVYPNDEWIAEISNKGEYLDKNVVIDGKIITASGPQAAVEFGKAVADIINNY